MISHIDELKMENEALKLTVQKIENYCKTTLNTPLERKHILEIIKKAREIYNVDI